MRQQLTGRLNKLPPPGRIAKDGSLMEWLQDYKETDAHHRHVSHLYGLYPADLITPETTPELAAACKATLEARGDDGPSWSIAYKLLCHAGFIELLPALPDVWKASGESPITAFYPHTTNFFMETRPKPFSI